MCISDRDGLKNPRMVEAVETDIALALKSQLLVNHGEPIMFAKLLELVIPLRSMTTQYLEEILNSPLQIASAQDRDREPDIGDPLDSQTHTNHMDAEDNDLQPIDLQVRKDSVPTKDCYEQTAYTNNVGH